MLPQENSLKQDQSRKDKLIMVEPSHRSILNPSIKQKSESSEQNTFDLIGSYNSDLDEDYSEKEDLIQNKNYYRRDFQPFDKDISKVEVEHLIKDLQ